MFQKKSYTQTIENLHSRHLWIHAVETCIYAVETCVQTVGEFVNLFPKQLELHSIKQRLHILEQLHVRGDVCEALAEQGEIRLVCHDEEGWEVAVYVCSSVLARFKIDGAPF